MRLFADGRLSGAQYVPSPNADERPPGMAVELLVIHSISLPPGEFGGRGIVDLFMNRLDPDGHAAYRELNGLRVSTHFLIRRGGEIIQFVPCAKRAWHAGVSNWRGRERCNDFSVGIELEGTDTAAFEEAQYRKLAELSKLLKQAYPVRDVVGHSDIAPGRKTDPGSCFDWERYRADIES